MHGQGFDRSNNRIVGCDVRDLSIVHRRGTSRLPTVIVENERRPFGIADQRIGRVRQFDEEVFVRLQFVVADDRDENLCGCLTWQERQCASLKLIIAIGHGGRAIQRRVIDSDCLGTRAA